MLAQICASTVLAADPAITVSAQQRYPWNGLVDLHFTVTGTSGTKYDTSFTAKDMVGSTNITMKTIRKSNGVAAAAKEQLLPGTYNWVWDAAADLPKGWKCDRVTVTGTADISAFPYSVKFNANGGSGTMANESFTYGTAKALTANAFTREGYTFQGWATSASGAKVYSDKQSVSNLTETSGAVVNLYAVWKSALYMVINLSSGAVSYLDAVPSGGWSNMYKSTLMVLRKIPTSGNVKEFYIGIFEITQSQWEKIGMSNNSRYKSSYYPVECISAGNVRQCATKLRTLTKLGYFCMPSEAQWLVAAKYGGGGYKEGNTEYAVGSLAANSIGVYDLNGNVEEWIRSLSGNNGSSAASYGVIGGYYGGRLGSWSASDVWGPSATELFIGARMAYSTSDYSN